MSFLLDTDLISEWVKARPNPGVIAWLAGVDEDRVFMSVVTLAELRYGVERMAAASRRKTAGGQTSCACGALLPVRARTVPLQICEPAPRHHPDRGQAVLARLASIEQPYYF